MKIFTHEQNQYKVEHGFLYKKTGNIWGYLPYISDQELRNKALSAGWKGNINENLICGGFHIHEAKINQL